MYGTIVFFLYQKARAVPSATLQQNQGFRQHLKDISVYILPTLRPMPHQKPVIFFQILKCKTTNYVFAYPMITL